MAELSDLALQRAADALHAAVVRGIATAPASVLEEADWEWNDEDWVRDAVEDAEHYAVWRLTGEHRVLYLAPGLELGRTLADRLAFAACNLATQSEFDLWSVPPEVQAEVRNASEQYEKARGKPLFWSPGEQ